MIGTWDLRLARVRLTAACAFLFLAAALFLVSQARGALYIGASSIVRVNLDGSLFEADFIPPQDGNACAIAVNSGYIYWADSYDDTIGRANLDGTAVDNDFITLADGAVPCGLALDSKYIYWSNRGIATIGRARLDGSEIEESFISTSPVPCAIAITQTGIYWASEAEDEIYRTDIKGLNGPEVVIDEGARDPCGLAIAGTRLFWVDDAGTIGRSNLDGSEPLPAFIVGGHSPASPVVQGGRLYWVNVQWGFESIGRADLDGNNVNQGFIGGLRFPYALAADSIQIVPRPPVPPQPPSALRLGKLRRHQDGSVFFPVDLLGNGWFQAEALGAKVEVGPEGVEGSAMLSAGRKWLKVTPMTKRGNGSRCVLRAFRRGLRVRLVLRLRFSEIGKTLFAKDQRFLLFKPPQMTTTKAKVSPVSCPPN